ncbi:putative transposase (plasmid) [Variovorax sp. PBL-H6]|nr:putative transposase [Variovorax sp. PBL-H6]VTU43703.1 putative transposase [Variovorax sp. SRS16]VTU43768.1 putative transposase [Variovorax sp. PBL-E5]
MLPTSKVRAKRTSYPKHDVTYEVREGVLEVSPALGARLHGTLDVLCELREHLRREREHDRALGRAARATGGSHRYLAKADQYQTVRALAARDHRFAGVHSQVLQNVADRLDHATKAWLKGERGAPTAVPRKNYRSLTFTQYGFAVKIQGGRLHMSRLGEARLIGLRKLPGRVKSVTLVFKQGRWFAQFTCEVQVQHCERRRRHASPEVALLPDSGLDTGLARIATLADGTTHTPAKPLKQMLPRLKAEQRKMSRQFEARKRELAAYRKAFRALGLHGPLPERDHRPLSNRLKRQIRRVAILHSRIECVRRDQLRKVARQLEQKYRLIAVEEHGVEFMKRNRRTSRSVSDVAPAMFKGLLKHALGERYVPVASRRPGIGGNSQTCLCGASVPKTLSERWHVCAACGLSADRDAVSANIAMDIAFGYSNLGAVKPPEPGQGLVRRGEGKCQAGRPVKASRKATEPPVKRPSSTGRRLACTAGAQATAGVKNPQLLPGALAPNLSG